VPRAARARAALWAELAEWPHAAVAFESPRRLPETLRSLAEALPQRPLAVCRELTKRWEDVARGTARELAQRYEEPPKGEITIVLGSVPSATSSGDSAEAVRAVRELVAVGVSRREAVAIVARLAGLPRNRLYSASL
jgi:16S rRNA (cytidine1402-2'-O)-methyltransferase